jgi:hypothetical protein
MEGEGIMSWYKIYSYYVLLSTSEILCLRYHEVYLYGH